MARLTDPGWRPDPDEDGRFRWWTGQAWTAWLATTAEAPPPPPQGPAVVPKRSRLGLWIFVAVLALALALFVGLTLYGKAAGPMLPGDPAATPTDIGPAPTQSAAPYDPVTWDAATRTLRGTAADFSCQLPGKPFVPETGSVGEIAGLSRAGKLSFLDSYPNWKDGESFPPIVGAGVLSPNLVSPDLADTTGAVQAEFARRFHRNLTGVRFGEAKTSAVTEYGRPAYRSESVIEYDFHGVAMKVTLSVLVVQARADTLFYWVQYLPSDLPAPALAAVAAATTSIRFA